MLVSEYIIKRIELENIDVIFGYQGGNITYFFDALYKSNIRFVETKHEQAAAFAANSYAQITGKVGVAASSSGPGATNMITGIANAYYDSIPCVFFTGNVSTGSMLKSKCFRQNAFQEADIVSMVKNITKYTKTILHTNEVAFEVEKAFAIAKEGRPGPVLLDIPHDIQRSELDEDVSYIKIDNLNRKKEIKFDINKIMNLLEKANKPIILLGGGARDYDTVDTIKKMLNKYRIPVVTSLCGLDCIEHNHPCFIGMIGMYGNIYANLAIYNCDLLLILGSRLADRQNALYDIPIAPNAQIIHVDIDNNELYRVKRDKINIHGTIFDFINNLIIKSNDIQQMYTAWELEIQKWKLSFPSFIENSSEYYINNFINDFSSIIEKNSVICSDVGQHQMSVAQSLKLKEGCKLLNSAGLGAMGYAIPAAIGAGFAIRQEMIYCFVGDGGFQMNLQELQTIVENKLSICIIVINNNSLGMIKAYQKANFKERYIGSVEGYSVPSISKIAKAFNIKYYCIKSREDYKKLLNQYFKHEPRIIEFVCNNDIKNIPEPQENNLIVRERLKRM